MDRNDRSEAKEAFGKQPASWSSSRFSVDNRWCADEVDCEGAVQVLRETVVHKCVGQGRTETDRDEGGGLKIDKVLLGSAQKMCILDAVLMSIMLSWSCLSMTYPCHLQKILGQFIQEY